MRGWDKGKRERHMCLYYFYFYYYYFLFFLILILFICCIFFLPFILYASLFLVLIYLFVYFLFLHKYWTYLIYSYLITIKDKYACVIYSVLMEEWIVKSIHTGIWFALVAWRGACYRRGPLASLLVLRSAAWHIASLCVGSPLDVVAFVPFSSSFSSSSVDLKPPFRLLAWWEP